MTERQVEAILLTDSRVMRCDESGHYRDRHTDRDAPAVPVGDIAHEGVAVAMMRTVCEWRRPLYGHRPLFVVDVDPQGQASRTPMHEAFKDVI